MISRIAIKNYRSLRDVELRPGPLTVLIGSNGAGKSNIIDALRFLKGVYSEYAQSEDPTRSQLEERGGFEQVVWGGLPDSNIEMEVEFSDDVKERHIYDFKVEIDYDPFSRPCISLVGSETSDDHTYINGIDYRYWRLMNYTQSWQFYNFSPASMRKPTKVKQESRLNETGSNLSTVIHSLFSEGNPDLDEAVEMLQVMVPTVERLVSPIYGDGLTYVALKEKGVKQPTGAWGLSDGTLLALALSVALTVEPLPKLICLETPEAEIHPHMLEAVADLLTSASYHAQIIVTSQSPHQLNWLPYDAFVIVDKEDGETRLTPLNDKESLRESARDLGTGDAWYSGFLGGEP